MEGSMVILANLNTMQERYRRLQNLKNEDERFNILAKEYSDDIPLIEFLDRKIVAEFPFVVDDNGRRKGYINCQLISSTENGSSKLIEKFSFNG